MMQIFLVGCCSIFMRPTSTAEPSTACHLWGGGALQQQQQHGGALILANAHIRASRAHHQGRFRETW
uniref:Putative secreted peptide n=1 Tax=Anopheles braziliensis TaxID=58242 RepID=A0A2M3ZXE5_9DIPT